MAPVRFSRADDPGLRRRGRKHFTYVDADGKAVDDAATLERIAKLAIPPAWTDVWICGDPNGHLQATGRDARGRKQYRYHAAYRAQREAEKFADLLPFGECLGPLRRQIDKDLRRPDLGHERILALVVSLLDRTAIRVGNETYARENKTFGLTTLRARHVDVTGRTMSFCFEGKGSKRHEVTVEDRRLARLVHRCQQLPGQLLFQWQDAAGEFHPVRSDDVNEWLAVATGLPATAKTFRTWHATVGAATLLAGQPLPEEPRAATSAIVEVCEEVAATLGNTRAVARASYVHPAIPAAFEAGVLQQWWRSGPNRPAGGLSADERRLLHVLARARRSKAIAA